MRVALLFACEGTNPMGGHKVLYEYANGLSARGHQVHVVHCASATSRREARTLRGRIRPLRYVPLALKGTWRPDNWFKLHPSVQLHFIPTLAQTFLPEADAYVAGWWTTAERLNAMNSLSGRRLYLLQHLETWAAPEQDVLATWKAPLEKIVIARWLQKVAEDLGQPSHYIPNGLDFNKFGCDVAPEKREQTRIAMMFDDRISWKGSADGIEALCRVKERYPDASADLFGVHAPSASLPAWINYHQSVSQQELRTLYNRATIFLAPSHCEGWGLPPAEAMTCGAAVVATDIGGHRETCVDNQTALMVPPKDSRAMAAAVGRLIDDNELRVSIANRACVDVQRFTWAVALDAFERVLMSGEHD